MAQIQQEKDKLNLAPKKFNMWIFIFTSFMFFAALTSGFIVYTGGSANRGIKIILPHAFLYSTVVIAASSVTLFLASRAAKSLETGIQQLLLWVTAGLGITFFALQFYGMKIMLIDMSVKFSGNPNASQSFMYVFIVMHLLHIIAGLGLLFHAISGTYKNLGQARNLFRMEFASIFWHFIDIIWIYLYVFLLLNQY